MIVTIHQPEHLIWLGLIDKIRNADLFVLLDTVQYEKNYYQNRNKIRTSRNWGWLTVPLKKHSFDTKIKDVMVLDRKFWLSRYLNLLKASYQKSEFFTKYFNDIKEILSSNEENLSIINRHLIEYLLDCFCVKTKIILASSLNLPEVRGGTLVNYFICAKLGADTYLSGPSGKEYLDQSIFKNNNIDVHFHEFNHPVYKQLYEPFIPGMSSVDLLFNFGPEAKNILWNKKN